MNARQRRMWIGASCGAAIGVLALGSQASLESGDLWAPIAVAALRTQNSVAVLTRGGEVWVIDAGATRLPRAPIAKIEASQRVADMAVSGAPRPELLLVTSSSYTSSGGRLTRLQAISLAAPSAKPQTWSGPSGSIYSGVVGDAALAYVGDAVRGEVRTQPLAPGASPSHLVTVRESGAARPAAVASLTIDSARQVLFIADAESGAIYRRDLRAKTLSTLVAGGGDPRALAFDSQRNRLLVADGSARCVWAFPVQSASPQKPSTPLAKRAEFREPSSIAIGTDGAIWVGDSSAGALFRLDANGALTRTIKP